jgi:carotenoid 1,2-hydratase
MHLVLDPAQESVHDEWLRRTPGAYEWWYFDALSDCGHYALTCIWFLGNPFSPYYRLASSGQPADPFQHNALFFALYRDGRLEAYHFSRFPLSQIKMDDGLTFGPNRLAMTRPGVWTMALHDENGNGRVLDARLTFSAPPLQTSIAEAFTTDVGHAWLPIAPACSVQAMITLREVQNLSTVPIQFQGTGYHDHNWGQLPFDHDIRDWYWARASFEGGKAAILYHVRPRHGKSAKSHFLLFEQGRMTLHDPSPHVRLSRTRINGFGTVYASRLVCRSGSVFAQFDFGTRLDSAPFYLRALCTAALREDNQETNQAQTGQGIGEYLKPAMMSRLLVASAMKARIVER